MENIIIYKSKVYYYKMPIMVLFGIVYISIGLLGLLLIMLLVTVLQDLTFFGLFVWFSLLCLVLFFAYGTIPAWNTYLELSPEGITYTNPIYFRIYTPWENIKRVDRLSRFRANISFVLQVPATRDIEFLEGKQRHLAVIERCSLLTTKTDLQRQAYAIPTRGLLSKKDLENGMLNAYLQQYAPHLSYPNPPA